MTSTPISRSWLYQFRQLVFSGRHTWWVVPLIWMAIAFPAKAAVEMRVAIEENVSQVKVGSSTKAVVRDAAQKVLGELAPMNAFVARSGSGSITLHNQWRAKQLWVEPTQGGSVWIGDRWYRGRVLLVPSQQKLTAVNYVDLEQYLYSVLGSEMNGNWPQEALKAQAVAARSYALYQRQRRTKGAFDLGDTEGWQVYKGLQTESTGTQMAVNATTGQVLTYAGRIIDAVFHSSSGGHTENAENVWVQALPYLRGVPDYDQGTPVFQWEQVFSGEQLKKRITGIGNILSLQVKGQTPTGRVASMKIIGDAGTRVMKGNEVRSALGLRSTLFTINPQFGSTGNKQSQQSIPIAFQVTGRGFGHGLGMSQWGAYNLAQQGYNYQQIVLHYYTGTTLAKIEVQ
ncbi:MAG: SpoIID/LytB domain-containing protein [Leptolyngbyaceae bacterium]|nr:SpoIID/LytB domain-containing protein [Leptolyngbyaceae bacterium]